MPGSFRALIFNIMNSTNYFAEAARRDIDNLSLELQRSADDDEFIESVEDQASAA